MAEIVIYSKDYCGYCAGARRLLDKKGVAYREIDVTMDRGLWNEMVERSGRLTVPQIFIDDTAIGGYTDLLALDRSGRLNGMLGLASDEPAEPAASSGGISALMNTLFGRRGDETG